MLKLTFLMSLALLFGVVSAASSQEHIGQTAFDLYGELWRGSTISDENQVRFIEDLQAFCAALKVSVEPLSASEIEWLDAVAPQSAFYKGRGVPFDSDDLERGDRIFNSTAYVRDHIISGSDFCVGTTTALMADFKDQSVSSRLGVLIYTIANLEGVVEALDIAGRKGLLLGNAPGWRVDVVGRGWSTVIRTGARATIMSISAFLARNT